MVRSRSRRRTHAVSRKRKYHAGPVVAFLIIASFGILFAGCGKETVIKGPDAAPVDDITFTQQDLERFQRLAGVEENSSSSSNNAESGGTVQLLAPSSNSGGEVPLVPSQSLDLSMVKKYAALRGSVSGDQGNTYRVANPFLNVRAEPNQGARLLKRLNEGEAVNVAEFVNGEWAKLQLPEGTGYAALRYLAKTVSEERLAQEKKPFENLYYVSFAFVNVRAKPDQKSEKLGEIPGKAFVRPLSVEGQWAKVPFEGKEGYVAMSYLTRFSPTVLVRQEKFTLPILHYRMSQAGVADVLADHVAKLKQAGVEFITFRDFQSILLRQESQLTVRLPAKAVLLAISDLTPQGTRQAMDILYGANVPATFFVRGKDIGMSGITQKMMQTLLADGFDVQSASQSGEDLRALTNAQVKAEVEQSRALVEQATGRPVFAIDYPQGGVNDRVTQIAADAGYLFGVGNAPEKQFLRSQLLRLPSYAVSSSMTADDVLTIVE